MSKNPTKETVEKKISDWKNRLNELYNQVEAWLPSDGPEIERTTTTQVMEEMMKKFKVTPQPIPVLSVMMNGKKLVFRPSGIWILGANGKVDVFSGDKHYTLVDLRPDDGPSDWRLVSRKIHPGTVRFDKRAFQQVIGVSR